MGNYIKPICLGIIIIVIGGILWRWHQNSMEDNTRSAIAKLQGKNDSLQSVLAVRKLEAAVFKRAIDSISNVSQRTIRDTIYINHNYVIKTAYVKHLSADSDISFLANRFNTPGSNK